MSKITIDGMHTPVDFDAAVSLMDDEIRETLHSKMAGDCDEQQFADAYCAAHLAKHGERFVVN